MTGFGNGSFRRWRGDVHFATLLSLQLVLLAFFVLLTAMSRFDGDRTRSVLDSVQSAFGPPAEPLVGPRAGPAGWGAAGSPDEAALRRFWQAVGRLVRTAIPLTRVETGARDVDAARIELPADAFFRAGEARLNPLRHGFLRRLVAALDRRPAGYRYRLEVRLPAGDRSGDRWDGEPQPLAVARAAALVRAAAAAGAPAASLSAGIGEDVGAGRILFAIRLESGPAPAGLFDEMAEE